MHIDARALRVGIALAMLTMVLAGCGGGERPGREAASEIVLLERDTQAAQNPQETPKQFANVPTVKPDASANIAAISTATPSAAVPKTSEKQTPNADIDRLMDDLNSTLEELEASITTADRDTLTDATLTALEK